MKAIWNDQVIAQSDDTIVVEDNHYFPETSINRALIKTSETTSYCPWKGTANYYHLVVNEKINSDAAWYYIDPKAEAAEIKHRVAFWKGVTVKK